MDEIKCPVCGSFKTKLFIISKDYLLLNGNSDDFSVYLCKNCNNGFSYPLLSNEELSKFYPDDYHCYKSHTSITGFIQKLKAKNDIRVVSKILKNNENVILEIGSGSGLYLYLLKKNFLNVSGIEMSIPGIKYAKENYNINLENCLFEDYQSSKKFDMIIAFHVLEHFTNPVEAIDKMKSMLNGSGYLYFKVPRLDSWSSKMYHKFWTGYDMPRHRVHFTKVGFIKLLSSMGFEIVFFKNDLSPLDSIRAVKYYSKFGDNRFKRAIFKILNSMPLLMKLTTAVVFEVIMSPFKSGKMSIIARKKT